MKEADMIQCLAYLENIQQAQASYLIDVIPNTQDKIKLAFYKGQMCGIEMCINILRKLLMKQCEKSK